MAECEVILERTLTAYEGYLYATQGSYGDQGPGSGYKGTFYAPILPDGRLGEWRQTTDRNLYRWNFGVGTKSGYLYLVGGQTGAPASTVTDVVEYARINPDGSLGAWHLAERLGQSRSARPGVVIAQGHLYAIGGEYMGRGLRSVEHAPILPDGSLGPWEFTSELEIPRPYATAAVLGGHVYVFGGEVHSFETDTVERAPINSDGTLGQWDVVGSLPETRGNHAMAMVADRVFLLGGVAAPMGSVERWSIARSDVRPDHGLNGWQTWGIGEDIRARMGSPRLHTFSWGPWIYISRQGTGSPLARARMCCYAPCCGGSVHDR